MSAGGWLRFVVLAGMWGCSFALIKTALGSFHAEQVACCRVVVGGLTVLVLVLATRTPLPAPRLWGHVIVAGVFGNVLPFLLFAIGERGTTSAVAGVVQGSTPLVTLALATALIPAERATARTVVGVGGGFVGLVIIVAPWTAMGGLGSIGGQLACVGAASSYAIAYVYIRRWIAPHGVSAMGLTCSQLVVAAAVLAVVTMWGPGFAPSGPPTVGAVVALVVLGGASTGLAFVLMNRLIADEGATIASTVNYVVPVVSVLVGWSVLDEGVGWNLPVGGAVVVASLALAENRLVPTRAGSRADHTR